MARSDESDSYPKSFRDSEGLHQLELLRPAAEGAPLVLMAAGWNGFFLYDGLATQLPQEFGVALLIAYPYPGTENTPILDAVVERADGFESLLLQHRDLLAENPIVALGYSRGGLIAHEIVSRLADRGISVSLEVLIDTLFPGEERDQQAIIARARRSKYQALAESGQYLGIVREVGRKATERTVRSGRRLITALSGPRTPTGEDGGLEWDTSPLTADDYLPPVVASRGVFYRAVDTPTAWTTDLWCDVLPDICEVEVEGRHTPPDSVMSGERVGQIARDLADRLRAL